MVIEQKRDEWADSSAERILEGLETAVKIVRITPGYKKLLRLKSINEAAEPGDVRIDEKGNIFTTRWKVRGTEEAGGYQRLINPSGLQYQVLSPSDKEKDYLKRLPRTVKRPVVELLFSEVGSGVETAIRQQNHILEGYKYGEEIGKEVNQVMAVVKKADELAQVFVKKKVTKKDLKDLYIEVTILLEEEGLISPQDPNKQKMKDMLSKVPTQDITGRVNPMISRIRARSAYIAGVRRLAVNGLVRKKFNSNLHRLIYEREITRWALKRAINQLQSVYGHVAFEKDKARTTTQASAISNILIRDVAQEFLTIPRVKPYLAPTRVAAIRLNGCREVRKEENRIILGKSYAESLFKGTSAVQHLKKRNFVAAGSAIIVAWATMEDALKKYESISKEPS